MAYKTKEFFGRVWFVVRSWFGFREAWDTPGSGWEALRLATNRVYPLHVRAWYRLLWVLRGPRMAST